MGPLERKLNEITVWLAERAPDGLSPDDALYVVSCLEAICDQIAVLEKSPRLRLRLIEKSTDE